MDLYRKKVKLLFKSLHIGPVFFVLVYFLIASLYVTYPLITNLSGLSVDLIDGHYINWIINWDIYAFTHNILKIFNANIFYPYTNTLAYSETFITSAILAFIPVKIIGEPGAAYNFVYILSLFSLGFCTYLLVRFLTHDYFSSVVSGTLVSFSTFTLTRYMNLQLLMIFFVPLAILSFVYFLEKKQYRYLLLSIFFFIAQTYNSFLPGYFIGFSWLLIFIFYFWRKKIHFTKVDYGKILLGGLVSIILLLPIVIPYYQVSKEFNYVRDIRDAIQFANRPEYSLFASDKTRLAETLNNLFYKNNQGAYIYTGYMGLMFLVLSVFALIYRFFSKSFKSLHFDIFLTLGVLSFILSLGPVFQWGGHVIKQPFMIPLPYALFYYFVPGFNGLRNSSRWEMLFLISFSVCVGIFLTAYLKKKTKLFKVLICSAICLFILGEFSFPNQYYSIPVKKDFPAVYSFIETLPKQTVIAELPMFSWNTFFDLNYIETTREYYSTLSFPNRFNGAAGFDPPPWQDKVNFIITNFPNKESLTLLKNNGVNYIVIHANEYNLMNSGKYKINNKMVMKGKEIKQLLEENKDVKLIYTDNNDLVYSLN